MSAPPACSEKEHLAPASREDVSWAKRLADAMTKGAPRKKLVCMIGAAGAPNGDFLEIQPRSLAFASAEALATADDHPEEAIEVRFAKGATPLVASVERAVGRSKGSPRIHFDAPQVRIAYLAAPKDVSVRALLTLDKDDATRVAQLRVDVSDLRGWKPKPIKCWDGAHVSVYPPSGDRFPPGTWTFEAVDAASRAPIAKMSCAVPADVLDVGSCTPAGEQPPAATLASMATAIRLHLPGQTPRIAVTIAHDGAPVATKELVPRYTTSGACTSALETITLRAP